MICSGVQNLLIQKPLMEEPKLEEEETGTGPMELKRSRLRSMFKHQYIDKKGGVIIIKTAGVSLHIPSGALSEKTCLSIEVKSAGNFFRNASDPSTRLTPIVSCKPDGITFQKPVELILPHCAEFDDIHLCKATARFVGGNVCVAKEWEDNEDAVRCVLKERYCHVYTTHFSDVMVNIRNCSKKRMLVMPFYGGGNPLLVNVWIINDLPSEQAILTHEEKELNLVPFSQTGRFIFENLGQCSLKVRLSLDDKSSAEFSKNVDIQQLFQSFRTKYDFEMDRKVKDASAKFVSVILLKEPVLSLQTEMHEGDEGEIRQEECPDENESQEVVMEKTRTGSDGIIRKIFMYQEDILKTISTILTGVQRRHPFPHKFSSFEPDLSLEISSLQSDIFKKITSFSEDIFWELTPDETELIRKISSFNTDIFESISAFHAGFLRGYGLRSPYRFYSREHYGDSHSFFMGASMKMISLLKDIFIKMSRFTGDVLKIHPIMQTGISAEVIGFLRDLVQVTWSFTKGSLEIWSDSLDVWSDYRRLFFQRTEGIGFTTTIKAAKKDLMEAITLFAKDYQTLMPGSSKDFAELRSSVESDFSKLSVSFEEEWRPISRREPLKKPSEYASEPLKKPSEYASEIDSVLASTSLIRGHLINLSEFESDPFKLSSLSSKEPLEKPSEYATDYKKEKMSQWIKGGAPESSKPPDSKEATAK